LSNQIGYDGELRVPIKSRHWWQNPACYLTPLVILLIPVLVIGALTLLPTSQKHYEACCQTTATPIAEACTNFTFIGEIEGLEGDIFMKETNAQGASQLGVMKNPYRNVRHLNTMPLGELVVQLVDIDGEPLSEPAVHNVVPNVCEYKMDFIEK
jgi:hypothetical protein